MLTRSRLPARRSWTSTPRQIRAGDRHAGHVVDNPAGLVFWRNEFGHCRVPQHGGVQLPPIFICNPYETAGMSDDAATAAFRTAMNDPATLRKQFRMDDSKTGPGQFGFLIPPAAAPERAASAIGSPAPARARAIRKEALISTPA